jgi:hypothetical protein
VDDNARADSEPTSCEAGRRGGVVNDGEADGKPVEPSEVKE